MYLVKTPSLVRKLLFRSLWRMPDSEQAVYLTFDDGPTPVVTPWVLEQLDRYNAKATFFLVGKNIEAYPDIFSQINSRGHTTGNHSYDHLKGWQVSTSTYLSNVDQCHKLVASSYFRPPYGKLKISQYLALRKKYRIVLWDVLSGDFDAGLSPEKCFEQSLHYTRNGSIIVFHDSEKSFEKLKQVLPKYLEALSEKGYCFKALPNS